MCVMATGKHRVKAYLSGSALSNSLRLAHDGLRMRILLAPYGTRGDVQPMLALALGLTSRGHRVKFVAPANFVEWIRAHGI